ncbi:MAG: SPOR domain-containing protein, partial [Proteobacteria bacterium]|nr:SPOR domain-containing protein [Pseudomonadota bacterium]
VIVEGQRLSLDPALLELHENDIFVDTRLLSRWFPVDIKFDLSSLTVTLTSREPIPIEQRAERDRKRKLLLGRGRDAGVNYPQLDAPYSAVDWPFIDTSIETSFRKNEQGKRSIEARYTSLLSTDLLFMNSKLFLAGNNRDKLTQARLEMGRKDPDGGLLGPLRVSEIALGDVAGPQVTLISRSRFGRGFVISSIPLHQPTEFDRITLRGELPLGWEAELYRNEVLLELRTSSSDGRYEFIDVPLLFGNNVLRVELFGPQGQRRQEIRRIYVGLDMVRPGERNFRVAASQQEKDLLPVDNDDIDDSSNKLKGKERFFAEVEQGINRNISVAAGISSLPLEKGRQHYGYVSTRVAAGGVFGRFDAVRSSDGGWAGKAALQTRIASKFGVFAEHGMFFDFVSEETENNGDLLRSRSKVRFDGVLVPPKLPRVPISISADLDRTKSGRKQLNIDNRLSTAIRRVSISNNLRARLVRDDTQNLADVSGFFLIGGRTDSVSLRGQIGYDLKPQQNITTAALTGEWFVNRDFIARLGVSRQLNPNRLTTYSFGLSRNFRAVSAGLKGDYNDNNEVSVRLSLSFAIGREPRKGDWRADSRSMADKGAISALVYLDKDANGRFNGDDTPLKGVQFRSNQSYAGDATDADGVAFVTGLVPDRRTNISIVKETLEDPYWVSRPEGVTFVPRPGVVGIAEFPVIATAEIDGTVYQQSGDSRHKVSNVIVQLVDQKGKVVKEVKSAFDGFYIFDFMLPGRYRLRIDPDQMQRLKLNAPPPRDISLKPEDLVNGEDFVIQRLSSSVDPSGTVGKVATVIDKAGNQAAVTALQTPKPDANEPPPPSIESKPPVPRASLYWVQLGAYRDPLRAELTRKRLMIKHTNILGEMTSFIRRESQGSLQGVYFQIRVGPFENRSDARALCAVLKTSGTDCFLAPGPAGRG